MSSARGDGVHTLDPRAPQALGFGARAYPLPHAPAAPTLSQSDELERLLAGKFSRFLSQRAESFLILRRRPCEGYDISFLITHAHLESMIKARCVA